MVRFGFKRAARGLLPEVPEIAPGLALLALYATGGTPIVMTDRSDQRARDINARMMSGFQV
ncbi:hypothetical protein UNPF46_00030 [Bradyrhizobium sp. UNPF46]|uniref:hypothetical protein n=1 Tax=Bradyrhizobium sp. UNPF46 TaxID=1141168 RepID=UPI001153EB92|nr:hypothetical protein [Bradyrhizobium sp. UNPF46]TQF44115.1 hypothetical protein UNPF46_00030 [Bradyrhizobium sp. UNPF46]